MSENPANPFIKPEEQNSFEIRYGYPDKSHAYEELDTSDEVLKRDYETHLFE